MNEAPDEQFLRQLGFGQDGDDDSREFGLYLWGINDKDTIEADDNEPGMQIVVSLEDGSMWLEAYKPGESLAIIEIPRKSRAELVQFIRALGNEVKATVETPADQINALHEMLRRFVHDLESNADPSGNIREAVTAREGLAAVVAQRDELLAAIRRHRDERGDDRCRQDDDVLYRALPEGFTPPARDSSVEIANCVRYIDCRQNPATEYVSPQRRIEELEAACKAAYRNISGDYTDGGEWHNDRSVIELLMKVTKGP